MYMSMLNDTMYDVSTSVDIAPHDKVETGQSVTPKDISCHTTGNLTFCGMLINMVILAELLLANGMLHLHNITQFCC